MATNIDLENISGQIESTLSAEAISEEDKSRFFTMKNWFIERRSHLKPWKDFCNTKNFSKPKNAGEVTKRLFGNVKTYQANYVFVSLLLVVYCILTSPLLLFGLSMSFGGCYYISTRGEGQPIKILGRELTVFEQYGLVFLISLPLFFLASAGSTVFWIIGASIFVIGLHASMMELKSADDAAIDLEDVITLQ